MRSSRSCMRSGRASRRVFRAGHAGTFFLQIRDLGGEGVFWSFGGLWPIGEMS